MIVATEERASSGEFRSLLDDSVQMMVELADRNPAQYLGMSPRNFEGHVRDIVVEKSKGGVFEGKIELVSGGRFPDIVAARHYGIEVKATNQDHWRTIGNSVMEGTRIEHVERIHLFFGKLANPIGFKHRPYEECLSDIAVTHSPRYLIDMRAEAGNTIFDRLGIQYDELRKLPNPVKPFVDYFRSSCPPGNEPWWMSSDETHLGPTVRAFSTVPDALKKEIRVEAYARFHEIFGKDKNLRYKKAGLWMVARYGVVSMNVRDMFSASGKVSLTVGNREWMGVPQTLGKLKASLSDIRAAVERLPNEEAAAYWPSYNPLRSKWGQWIEHLVVTSDVQFPQNRDLLSCMLAEHAIGLADLPPELVDRFGVYLGANSG